MFIKYVFFNFLLVRSRHIFLDEDDIYVYNIQILTATLYQRNGVIQSKQAKITVNNKILVRTGAEGKVVTLTHQNSSPAAPLNSPK